MIRLYSPVAQSVEQVTVNHWVGGSSPSGGAKYREGLRRGPFLFGAADHSVDTPAHIP